MLSVIIINLNCSNQSNSNTTKTPVNYTAPEPPTNYTAPEPIVKTPVNYIDLLINYIKKLLN